MMNGILTCRQAWRVYDGSHIPPDRTNDVLLLLSPRHNQKIQ